MTLAFLSLSFGELLVIGFVALLVFGGQLPEVMRNLGRAYAKFRQGLTDATRPIREEMTRLDERARTDMGIPPARRTPPPVRYEAGAAIPSETPEPKRSDTPTQKPEPRGGVADEPPPV